MAEPPEQNDRNPNTGEFVTDEYDRTIFGDQPVRRRRRRRKSTKSAPSRELLRTVGIGLLCVMLVLVGVWLGLNYRSSDAIDEERYRLALQARQQTRERWLNECGDNGHSQWTCNKFDRAHFEAAALLDDFHCENVEKMIHYCSYLLGDAQVVVAIPTAYKADGEYRSPRARSHAVISHSDRNDRYYISVSEKGHIEIREQTKDRPLFVINPSTGTLNSLQADVEPGDDVDPGKDVEPGDDE